jgi:two-component system, cell cycle sensor histidine kinase and response regulator CckA
MKILIVEDEGILAFNIRRYLSRVGHEICGIADNGRDAVELAGRHRPDLILMDVRLKDELDGVEAALQIRAFLQSPILFTTAFGDADSIRRIRAISGTKHLAKPYDLAGLAAAVEQFGNPGARQPDPAAA